MILIMFQKDIGYFPTLREIRNELMAAQLDQVKITTQSWKDNWRFEQTKDYYMDIWRIVFSLEKLGDLDKPLTPSILSNPEHAITQHILYIYSMETFIYKELNLASRVKDKSKI